MPKKRGWLNFYNFILKRIPRTTTVQKNQVPMLTRYIFRPKIAFWDHCAPGHTGISHQIIPYKQKHKELLSRYFSHYSDNSVHILMKSKVLFLFSSLCLLLFLAHLSLGISFFCHDRFFSRDWIGLDI